MLLRIATVSVEKQKQILGIYFLAENGGKVMSFPIETDLGQVKKYDERWLVAFMALQGPKYGMRSSRR